MLNKPCRHIGTIRSLATRYCSVVAVIVDHLAGERSRSSQEFIKRVRRDLAASVLGSGLVRAELRTLRRVYAEDADVHAVDFDSVAVNHAGSPQQLATVFARGGREGRVGDERDSRHRSKHDPLRRLDAPNFSHIRNH